MRCCRRWKQPHSYAHKPTAHMHMWLHEKPLPWLRLGSCVWNDIWRRCSCLDLLASRACKVPQTSRGDRLEEMGQVGEGTGKGRPRHILKGGWEPWHSALTLHYYGLKFLYACAVLNLRWSIFVTPFKVIIARHHKFASWVPKSIFTIYNIHSKKKKWKPSQWDMCCVYGYYILFVC